MLGQFFHDPRSLGVAQAAITIVFAVGVRLLARRGNIHLERETTVALIPGFVQVLVTGWALLLLLQAPVWISILVLLAMIVAAAILQLVGPGVSRVPFGRRT